MAAAASSAVEVLEGRAMLSTTYYVSASTGADDAAGTSVSAPFQTIQRAASLVQPGDTVLIRGGTYRETVTPARSGTAAAPITFKAYDNEAVTISGADLVGGWSNYKDAIYQAPQAWDLGLGNNQVFVDGQMMIEARWPNTTLDLSHPVKATMDSASATSTSGTLVDGDLAQFPAGAWDGAILHMVPGQSWFAQTGTVTSSATPGQLSFSYARMSADETPTGGDPYYLTGKFVGLDSPTEWFRDPSSGQLYLWTPVGDSPAGHVIEAKRRAYAFDLKGKGYVTVEGIDLFAATVATSASSSHLVLNGIDARYVGHFTVMPGRDQPLNVAVLLQGDHHLLANSTIRWAAGSGVVLNGTDSRVENTTVADTNYNGGSSAGIRLFGGGHAVVGNTVYNSGRDGIKLSGSTRNAVTNNVIHDVMLQTTDGGAIYTYGMDGQGTEIAYNRIYGVHSGGNGATGIMLDNGSSNYLVHHNAVSDVDYAMKMNTTSRYNRVVNNTFVSDRAAITGSKERDFGGSVIANNLFATAPQIGSGATVLANQVGADESTFVDLSNGDLRLATGSLAIDAGAVLAPLTDGFAGAAPDVGAYEFGRPAFAAGATVATPPAPTSPADDVSTPTPVPVPVPTPMPAPDPTPAAPVGVDQTIEAEAATVFAGRVASNNAGFTGTGFVDYLNPSGDYVEFAVNAPADGSYGVEFRYANGSVGGRSMDLSIDGQAVAGGVTFAPTGSWSSWRSVLGSVSLSAGSHTVRLTASGQSGPNLDAITLKSAAAEAPAPAPAPVVTTLEAESAQLRGALASAARSGFTGAGFADYINAAGDFVRWTFDAPSAGTYDLSFRYANGSSADRPLELRVNGDVAEPPLGFAPTGSWSAWRDVHASVTLAAGTNVVLLVAVGASGANVDSLVVTPLLSV